MGWLVLNEYEAEIAVTPEGAFAKYDIVQSRLVEQRMMIEAEPNRSRAFTALTTMIIIAVDCDCWLEVVPSGYLGFDMVAGEERAMTVNAGAQLIAVMAAAKESVTA